MADGGDSSAELPPEIWLRIMEDINNPRTLAYICRTSKSMRDHALPCLYHDVYVEPMNLRVFEVFQAMFNPSNDGLASIRTLRISGYIDVPGPTVPWLLRTLFDKATSSIPVDTVQALKWEDAAPPLGLNQFLSFLRKQRNLRRLQLPRLVVGDGQYASLKKALLDEPLYMPNLNSLVSVGARDNGRDPLSKESAIVAATDDFFFLRSATDDSKFLQSLELKFHGPRSPTRDRRFRALFRRSLQGLPPNCALTLTFLDLPPNHPGSPLNVYWRECDVINMKRMNLEALNLTGRTAALGLLAELTYPPAVQLKSLCLGLRKSHLGLDTVEKLLCSFTGLERLHLIIDSGPAMPDIESVLHHSKTLKSLVVYAAGRSFINGVYDHMAVERICHECMDLHTLGLSFFVFGQNPNPESNSNEALPLSQLFIEKLELLKTLPNLGTLAIINHNGDYGWTSWTRSARTRRLVTDIFAISDMWQVRYDTDYNPQKHPLTYVMLGGVPGARHDSLLYRRRHQPYCANRYHTSGEHFRDSSCLLDPYEIHSALSADHLSRDQWSE